MRTVGRVLSSKDLASGIGYHCPQTGHRRRQQTQGMTASEKVRTQITGTVIRSLKCTESGWTTQEKRTDKS